MAKGAGFYIIRGLTWQVCNHLEAQMTVENRIKARHIGSNKLTEMGWTDEYQC
jgi:hypothetical protein